MDVGRYKHNYEGFYIKITYQMSINRGRMTTTQGAHASLVVILTFFFSFSLGKELKEEIKSSEGWVDTARG